ncbi:hypothetical protein AVEN_158064-1 [Araneus ventricosus]|uniref:Uncharacterized protein n=1 Tax=Araneus ventricosus TaxID=182803 RepID=A0A4Y2MS08_ARAVE|nr:hypothetical protein AVEN_158064-1 [Araneus ventricosus]
MILSGGIPSNSKSKTSCADSNLRPRCEARGTSKGLPRLRPRDEARKLEIRRVGGEYGDRRSMVAHFGAYVNDMRNFSIKMGGGKTGLGQMFRIKQEEDPDFIEKPVDLSEQDNEDWINVDTNLETAEKTTEETICQAWMNRRDDVTQQEDSDDEEGLEEKSPSVEETCQALRTIKR